MPIQPGKSSSPERANSASRWDRILRLLLVVALLQTLYQISTSLHLVQDFDVPSARTIGTATASKETTPVEFAPPRLPKKNATTHSKSRLFLHVGPMKTATTTIQTDLWKFQNHPLWKKDHVKLLLDPDYVDFGNYVNECLLQPTLNGTQCRKHHLKGMLKDRLVQGAFGTEGTGAATTSTNGTFLHSCETYSIVPGNDFAIQELRALQEHFDVTVVAVYRRPAAWFASLYRQMIKLAMYRSRANLWRKWGTGRTSFQSWWNGTATVRNYEYWNDTAKTIQFYRDVLGASNVKVLDYHADDLELEFFCGIGIFPNLCRELPALLAEQRQETTLRKNNDNSFLLFDEDLMAVEAYRQGYFEPKEYFLDRHDVTLQIQTYFDAVGRDNLPKRCLSSDLVDWMWNRTTWMEAHIAPHPVSDPAALRQEFDADMLKFCEVDAAQLLQTDLWKRLLSSCVFWKAEHKSKLQALGKTCHAQNPMELLKPQR